MPGQSLVVHSCFPAFLSVCLSLSFLKQNTLNILNMHLSSLLLHYALISVAHSPTCLLCHSLNDSLIKNTDFPRSNKASFFLLSFHSFFFTHVHSLAPQDLKVTRHKTAHLLIWRWICLVKRHKESNNTSKHFLSIMQQYKMQQQCWS